LERLPSKFVGVHGNEVGQGENGERTAWGGEGPFLGVNIRVTETKDIGGRKKREEKAKPLCRGHAESEPWKGGWHRDKTE